MHPRPDRSVARLFAVLGVLLALSPLTAAAQDGDPRVYIVSAPMSDDLSAVATRCGAAARAALRSIDGVNWRGPDQLFLGYDDSAVSVLERARVALEEGRGAYLQLELEQAIDRLSSAVEAFDAAAAALEDPEDLGQALLFLGASYGFNEQRREAMAAFGRLHRQMPHITPDPDTFPPEIIELFAASRPRDARSPAGVISIDSDPQGAIAYVDFLARGRTPIVVDGLIQGDHVVRVTRPGATPFVESTGVRRGRTADSSAYLVDSPGLEGLSELIDQVPQAEVESLDETNPIREIAARLDLDVIGVIRVSPLGGETVTFELILFNGRTGARMNRGSGEVPTAVGRLENSVQSAVRQIAAATFSRSTSTGEGTETGEGNGNDNESPFVTPEAPTHSTPITEEWWFWTIIGVVAAGGIAAAIAVPLATQGPPLGDDPQGQIVFTF